LFVTAAALVLGQIAELGQVSFMSEPSTVMSSIVLGLLLARYNNGRRRGGRSKAR